MPKPIYMTDAMIDECFDDVLAEFTKQYEAARTRAKDGKEKLAKGVFNFVYKPIEYTWIDDHSRVKIILEPVAFSKMLLLMLGSDKEIGWHGLITRDAENPSVFHVEDVILFPQTVTSTTVTADDEKYPLWAMDLPDETFAKCRFHGHSHVNMGVTPSVTDLTYYEQSIQQFKDGFYVFMIMNKRLETFCQVYDFDRNAMYENAEIDIQVGTGFKTELDAAKKEMIIDRVYNYGGSYNSGYGSYSRGSYGSQHPYGTYTDKKDFRTGFQPSDPKKEKKDSAVSEKNAGEKTEDKNGQKQLILPPYYDDDYDDEPWWKNGGSRS